MGELYVVMPLNDPKNFSDAQGIIAWLRSLGIACPTATSRFPTLQELRAVLDHLEGFTVRYSTGPGHWSADIVEEGWDGCDGESSYDWAYIVAGTFRGDETRPQSFYFDPGAPRLMHMILRHLAAVCGPQLLLPTEDELPLVVTADLDVQDTLAAWPN
jgi:hypothetical protein